MIPKRPFLLRAFYDWIVESNMTPHILVNSELDEVTVPKQHIKDGKIVLNVSPMAVQDFMMDNEALSFSARFGGVAFYIYCPMYSIEAIYSRESSADGISFSPDEYADIVATGTEGEAKAKPAALTLLSAVDSNENNNEDENSEQVTEQGSDDDESVDIAKDVADDATDQDEAPPPPRKRPSLRVVK